MSKNFFNASSASASINFPSSIEITEKKAPTDESVEILHDMEEKALKNVIAKVSGCNNNVIIWEAYFSKVTSLSFEMMGILTLRMRINGKVYMRSVKTREKIMKQLNKAVELHESRALHMFDLDNDIQGLILFEIGVIMAQCIVDGNGGNNEQMFDVINRMAEIGVTEFSVTKMEEELNKGKACMLSKLTQDIFNRQRFNAHV